MKEHKKLYKSGKLWMTATVMAFAAGATLVTTTAHADTTANTAADTTQNSTDQVAQQEQKVSADQDAVNKAQTAVDANKKDIDQASHDLQKAQQDQRDAQSQIDALKNSSMSSDQAQSTIDYLTKKANYYQQADLQRKEEQAQVKINKLNDQVSTLNSQTETATVPNGRIDKSKSLLENASRNNLWDNFYSDEQNGNTTWNQKLVPNNIYISPDNDKSANHGASAPSTANLASEAYSPYGEFDKVNATSGMTEDQARELSILLLNELNHAREQRGLAPFVMTEDQFKRAMARAAQPSARVLDHNESDMNSVLGNWHSENLALVNASADNMLSLLNNANGSVSRMLMVDADSNWGHRDNFLENGNYNAAFGFKLLDNGFYVMTFDTTYVNDTDKANDLVTNTINNYAAMGPTKDATANDQKLNNQISDLKQQISDLQGTIKQLSSKEDNLQFDASYLSKAEQDQYNQAKAQLNSSQTLADAQAKLQQATQAVQTAQSTKDSLTSQTSTLQNQLDAAKATLAKDQELLGKLKAAQQVSNLQPKVGAQKQTVANDQKTVDTAKQDVDSKQAAYDAAVQTRKDTWNQNQADLAAARAAGQEASEAQQKLDAAKAALAKDPKVVAAQQQETSLKAELVKLVPHYGDFLNWKLRDKEEAALSGDQKTQYNQLQSQYRAAQDTVNDAQKAAGIDDLQADVTAKDQKHIELSNKQNASAQKYMAAFDAEQQAEKDLQTAQNNHDRVAKQLQSDQAVLMDLQAQLDQLTQKDNVKYTNLNPSLVMKVNVTAGDTNIPAPKLTDDAFIKNTNTASAAMFMVLAQTNGTYPEGTTVEWADPAKVQKDAQTAGTYDEEVILDFPDGSKSKAFNVPGVLVVAAKQTTPSTNPTKPTETDHTLTVHYIEVTGYAPDGKEITKVVGTQTFTGKQGDTFSGSQLNVPAGYKLAKDGVTYTIGDQNSTLEQPVVSVNTPSTPSTDPNKGDDKPATQEHTLTVHYIEVVGYEPMGAPITKVVGTQTFTGKPGQTFGGDQLKLPAGYKLAMDGVTYTITDKDEVNETPVISVNTPSSKPTPSTDEKTDSQLPAGAKVVNNHVVDANGNILAGWKVVNGQAVKENSSVAQTAAVRNAQPTKANNDKKLPQTGNADSLAMLGLGAASLLSMFGLAELDKKRGWLSK